MLFDNREKHIIVTLHHKSSCNVTMSFKEGSRTPDIGEENGIKTVLLERLFSAIAVDVMDGVPASRIALDFHNTMAEIVAHLCRLVANESCLDRVVLSGGVFQNRLLLKRTVEALTSSGLTVITHSQVPCNDGGISLGQAVIANAVIRI